jgi:acyl-CoA hydrolase
MRILKDCELARVILDHINGTNPRVVVTGNFATPWHVLDIFDKVMDKYSLFMANAQPGIPNRPDVTWESPFVGAGMRGSDSLKYYPCRLSMVPELFKREVTPDVVIIHVSSDISDDGCVSLGTEVNILPAAINAVRMRGGMVIAQLDDYMPYTYGDSEIFTEFVDYAVVHNAPLQSPAQHRPSAAEVAVARNVSSLIPDGSVIQRGIGNLVDALDLTGKRGLRVKTEMASDWLMDLDKAGALADEKVYASFMFGSQEFYTWLDHNKKVRMLRTEMTNDPGWIEGNKKMVSINTALMVDLRDQANASFAHGNIYSGFGGATDYQIGAMHSQGGMAILAMTSWHDRANASTIVAKLDAPVTSFQHTYVVTDRGIARMFGKDATAQAEALIKIADPRAREALQKELDSR